MTSTSVPQNSLVFGMIANCVVMSASPQGIAQAAAGYFDAPGASEAALMVATGQKEAFGNVVMVFCNNDK